MTNPGRLAFASFKALAFAAMMAAGARAAEPSNASAELATYTRPDGESFFALSLEDTTHSAAAMPTDVVLLFDTSASQTADFRDKALSVLEGVLSRLSKDDRIQLFAVDLSAVPLTTTFVAPNSDAAQRAMVDLRGRAPLGATDFDVVLDAAAGAFSVDDNTRGHAVVYIGDGMSAANILDAAHLQSWIDQLVSVRASVTSFAVGPRLDTRLLGALASHTGGMLAIDDETISADEYAGFVATSAVAPVVWPASVALPAGLAEAYPQPVPPIRRDRQTVLVGAGKLDSSSQVRLAGHVNGQPVELSWTVAPAASNEDYSFLPQVVGESRKDGGLALAFVGAEGLKGLGQMVNFEAFKLARLGQQAVATGNLEHADQLAAQALRMDPANPEATLVRDAVAKARTAPNGAASNELRLAALQPQPGSERAAEEALAPGIENPLQDAFNSEFLSDVERQTDIFADFMRTEVQSGLNAARGIMSQDPLGAIANLKLLLERVRQAPELRPELRRQLATSIEAALQAADREAFVKQERDLARQQREAQAEAQSQINRELFAQQQRVEQLMARFNSLMDEKRYRDAQEVVAVAQEILPRNPTLVAASEGAEMQKAIFELYELKKAKERGFMSMLYPVDVAAIPTSDEPPVLYPDPEVWQLLTERRRKYKAVDLTQDRPAEAKILAALDDTTPPLEFIDTPLDQVTGYIADQRDLPIHLDAKALIDEGIGTDAPVTANIRGISLRSALRLVLRDLELTYIIRDEVLLITTTTEAESLLSTKVYPVADLVIPIQSGSLGGALGGIGGGLGGGGGGGFGGGGGGGFGGGGGGGFGGGGGGGGFGGGGFFSVPDDGADTQAAAGALAVKDELKLSSATSEAAVATSAPVTTGASSVAKPSAIATPAGDTPDAAWEGYFASTVVDPAVVRETVRKLMNERKFDEATAAIMAALRNRQGQTWMYEALGLSMQLAGKPHAEIERALMSLADFATSPADLFQLGDYMSRSGLAKSALRLFRQASQLEPTVPHPYVAGLRLAERLNDLDGIRWSTVGILGQAWPAEQRQVWLTAYRTAAGTLEKLRQEKRDDEAAAYQKEIDAAMVRDCVIVVSWIGDADLDLLIEEPLGTICSFRNPRTTAGGVMLGDALSPSEKRSPNTKTEVYVCTRAFDGIYKGLVRRVWGKLPVDKIMIDIYAHQNAKHERVFHRQIDIKDDQAVFSFEMQLGRRKDPLPEEQVATAIASQVEIGHQIMAQQRTMEQQVNGLLDDSTLGGVLTGPGRQQPFVPGLFRQSAVGYQPVIVTLPEGTNLIATAVVSADRRYVRVTPSPIFSAIPEVNTFNFATGSSGTSGGGGAGTGGGTGGGGGI